MLSLSRGRLSRSWCVCVLACVVLAGCRGGEDQRASAEPSGSRTGADESQAHLAEARRAAECRIRQRNAVGHLHGHIYSIPDMVTSASSGSSREASTHLRHETARALTRVQRDCQVQPTSMLRFATAIRQITATPMDRQSLERLSRAYGEWTGAVGGQWRAREIQEEFPARLALCSTYDRGIKAWYDVRTSEAEYGKNMWVDWTLRNDTRRTVVVNQDGSLWARGVLPAYRGEWDPARKAWLYTWGASSADPQSRVQSGEQVSLRANVVIGHLPMRSDGAIVRVRPGLYVTPAPAGRHPTCAVPVKRAEP